MEKKTRKMDCFLSPSLSPNSDQHQISSCNINAYSAPGVMRIKDMITEGELSRHFNFSLMFFIRKVLEQNKRISVFFDVGG